ncbi:unnamed protein product [Eruca vesicaria subsp. sativa]|uniref:Uncharacterized protein n=1 Tax=Eruca vesicaria subsp. sativa TaxID=29727 RepID=A0ABC8JTR3_ERUVS|nr:unnamed protein product [Eruca vesicaria subsp. sativa]
MEGKSITGNLPSLCLDMVIERHTCVVETANRPSHCSVVLNEVTVEFSSIGSEQKLILFGSRRFFLGGRKENGGLVRSESSERRTRHIPGLPKLQQPHSDGGATASDFDLIKKERGVNHS